MTTLANGSQSALWFMKFTKNCDAALTEGNSGTVKMTIAVDNFNINFHVAYIIFKFKELQLAYYCLEVVSSNKKRITKTPTIPLFCSYFRSNLAVDLNEALVYECATKKQRMAG